jgi:hypothetical protein
MFADPARSRRPGRAALLGAVCLLGTACSATPGATTPDQLSAAAEGPPAPAPLRPLTPGEQQLRAELESEARELAELGPRSLVHSWNLHSATDHLARKLEVLGYEVKRQGFPVGEEILQNLEVALPGTRTGEALVIAAHYDTAAESPGANASASGAVVLLSLARELRGKRFGRGVRLVWLSNESGGQGTPGSAVYAAGTRHARLQVAATLTLGSLGNYSLAPGSQRYPAELLYGAEGHSPYGDFIAVLSNAGSFPLLEHVRPLLASASLPVEELVLPDQAPLAADGPQARFWQAGLTGLVLTDTAQFRSPYPEGPGDTLDKLDFDRLARVRGLLATLVTSLAGAPGQPGAVPPSATPPAAVSPAAVSPAAVSPAPGEPAAVPPAAESPSGPETAPGGLLPELPPLKKPPAPPPPSG